LAAVLREGGTCGDRPPSPDQKERPESTPKPNQCCACGEDFASLAAFGAHILIKPANLKFDCIQVFELRRRAWVFSAGVAMSRRPPSRISRQQVT
jgi:hypothetical protein